MLSHDDVMDHGARYFAANLKKKAQFFKILLLTFTVTLKIYTFVVILMSHVSPVVFFVRLG